MHSKVDIAKNWLPRYTGTPLEAFGDYILLTNFHNYVDKFSQIFDAPVRGAGFPMQTCTNKNNVTIINFGMGPANAATIMDLLTAISPKAVLLLGKCGGLKASTSIGHFILPIAAIWEGKSAGSRWVPPEVPSLPSFKLHKFVSEKIVENKQEYRTGVIYTTNRRLWEWDEEFKKYLKQIGVIGIDMETATVFTVGYANRIPRGALLLVSDVPLEVDGIKTDASDLMVTQKYVDLHLQIGIESMMEIGDYGEEIRHFNY